MALLGAHPRLAAMLLAADTPARGGAGRRPRRAAGGTRPAAPSDAPADIGLRLAAIAEGDPAADRGALSRIRRAAAQYRRRLRLPTTPADGDPGRLLAAAFPDRIAQRRGEPGSFRLSGGGGARLPRTDPLASAPLLAVAALETEGVGAHPAGGAARSRRSARRPRVTEQVETSFDPVSGAVLARRRRRLGALVLTDRTEPADPAEVAAALARAVAADGLRPLPWTDAARQLQARVALMRRIEPDAGWPDLSDGALAIDVQDWLAPQLGGMSRLADLARLDLHAILRGLLPWDARPRLDAALPRT